jgi:hypothetical protein
MKADPSSLASSPVLILCLKPGRTYTSIVEEKASDRRKWLAFLVNVWFCAVLTLTLNQRVRSTNRKQRAAYLRDEL